MKFLKGFLLPFLLIGGLLWFLVLIWFPGTGLAGLILFVVAVFVSIFIVAASLLAGFLYSTGKVKEGGLSKKSFKNIGLGIFVGVLIYAVFILIVNLLRH